MFFLFLFFPDFALPLSDVACEVMISNVCGAAAAAADDDNDDAAAAASQSTAHERALFNAVLQFYLSFKV